MKRRCLMFKNKLSCMLTLVLVLTTVSTFANQTSCYSNISYATPEKKEAERALYVFVDETIPLSDSMKKKIQELLTSWGKPGDLVKIARFSASYRELYPELVYSAFIEQKPDEKFMYNLHYMDKKQVMECLEEQKSRFKLGFETQLKAALKNINPKIPKSEILGSLKLLSKQLVLPDKAKEKILFLITDGIENSGVTSFYARGALKNIDHLKTISSLRKKGMMGYWKNTQVYVYGLGLLADKKQYVNPNHVQSLKRFWERYFVESGGKILEIGTPELLLTEID